MLINLYIENYVLFDKQNLNFNDGFISLTGDTGAGKSLIIDALGYLCGDRLTSNISKDPSKNTYIEGNFTFNNEETLKVLEEAGIEREDVYIVSRDISTNGKSISRINGRSVTQSLLKQVFDKELDIHSQRDTQYLLNKSMHLDLVDAYADHKDLLKETSEAYKLYASVKKEIYDLENSIFNEEEIEFIKSQLKEIDKINPDESEYEELLERQKMINSFETIFNYLKTPQDLLSSSSGVVDRLYETKSNLERLVEYEEYQELFERVNSIYIDVVDINDEITQHLSALSFDEYELNNIEERLFEVNHIIKRFGGSFEIFKERYQEMMDKVEKFDSKDIVLHELNKKLKTYEENYITLASKLSKSRKDAISKLEKDIMSHLKDLYLENASFKVNLKTKAYSNDGFDDVEFLVAMNKGFALEPLIKVASGGELSRLMLGLKVVFSKLFGVSTVVFDEIDTGVSGIVASSIGYKMSELSKFSQVFAVTHLAQVAACSDYHFYVEKDNTQTMGETSIKELEAEEFIEKLSLMSTGLQSEASLKAARELYTNSQSKISDSIG